MDDILGAWIREQAEHRAAQLRVAERNFIQASVEALRAEREVYGLEQHFNVSGELAGIDLVLMLLSGEEVHGVSLNG